MRYKKKKRFGYDGCMKSFWKNARSGFSDSRNNDKERSRSPPKNNYRSMYQSRDNSYQPKKYDNSDRSEDRYPRREPQQYMQRTEFNPQNRYSQIKPNGFSQSQEKPTYNYYQTQQYQTNNLNQQKPDYTKTASYQLQHQKYNDLISNKYNTDQRQQQNSLSNQQNSYESYYKAQVPQYKLPETSMVNTNGSSYWTQIQQKNLYETPVSDKPRPSLASYADSYNNTNNVNVQVPQTNPVLPQTNQSVLTPQQNSTNFDTNSYYSYKKSVIDSYGKENPNSLVSTNASKTKEAPR